MNSKFGYRGKLILTSIFEVKCSIFAGFNEAKVIDVREFIRHTIKTCG